MCRVQAAEDIIGDDADAPDANGVSDAAGVIAAGEEVAPAEKAPVEAVADEAVVEVPHGTSIDLSSDSHRLPTPRPAMPSMATVSPLPITGDDVPILDWNVDEPHHSDSALNLQPVLTTRMREKVSELSDLARKVDTKACNMQSDGCTVPRPFLDAVLLYTMQCHFYVVLNSELRLLQSTAIPLELSNAIYLAWRRYVRLLLKGSTVRFFVLCRYLRMRSFACTQQAHL